MFKVLFSNSRLIPPFEFAALPTLEDAVSLSLAVHRSSNLPHHIQVRDNDGASVISFDLYDKSPVSRDSAKNE